MAKLSLVRGVLIALLVCAPALAAETDSVAEDQARQQSSQPGNNAPIWRQARSGAPQTTTVRGVETGVLIQSRGETWRELRPPLALLGGVLLALAMCALGAFYAWRGPIGTTQPPTGKRIERFSYADRLAHWTTGISFVVLAATGTLLTFGKYLLLPLFGYSLFAWLAAAAKNAHNFAGPLFALSLVYFIARYVRDNLPRRWDIDWLLRFGGMFSGAHVPSGRFNAGEKTLFWGLVCLFSTILCVTGLVLDFPNAGQGRALMQDANIIHLVTAMFAIAASLFHIYLGTIGVKGAYAAMRKGMVDESWAREHHEIWYEQVKAGHSRQHFVEPTLG